MDSTAKSSHRRNESSSEREATDHSIANGIVLHERTDPIAGTIIEAYCETCRLPIVSWHQHDHIDLASIEKTHRCRDDGGTPASCRQNQTDTGTTDSRRVVRPRRRAGGESRSSSQLSRGTASEVG